MATSVVNQNVFRHLLLNKYLNIFLIKHLLTWIYFGLWLVMVDIFWLSVVGGGWWWIYFDCWLVVVGGVGSTLAVWMNMIEILG